MQFCKMKLKYCTIIFTLLILVSACKQKETVKAKIIERTIVSENEIKIRFKYQYAAKEYIDSVTIKNDVIKEDSIFVTIDTSQPGVATTHF